MVLQTVIWYNFHHNIFELLPQNTLQNCSDFVKWMSLWSLLLFFLFSTELLVNVKCFQPSHFYRDKITFTAFLCLHLELTS